MKGPTINDKPHDLVVLLVTGRDENGRPRECRVIYDDESVEMQEGLEFMTAFVPTAAVKARD